MVAEDTLQKLNPEHTKSNVQNYFPVSTLSYRLPSVYHCAPTYTQYSKQFWQQLAAVY